MFTRRFSAAALLLSLIPAPGPGSPEVLGIITQASDANLGTGPLSVGTSIYDGDRLSTDADGALTFRGPAAILYLSHDSRMTLRRIGSRSIGARADLSAGTLAFTAAKAADIEIFANAARIHAIADTPTIGQVTIIDPKTLYIYARQGSLYFSYEDESGLIPEGKSYRVILDPPDDSTRDSGNVRSPNRSRRGRRAFLFILLGVGASAAIGALVRKTDNVLSPDHP
jgi:hypothetical protein